MPNIQKCEICGEEYSIYDMHKYFTGRTRYVCRECFKSGQEDIRARLSRKRARRDGSK